MLTILKISVSPAQSYYEIAILSRISSHAYQNRITTILEYGPDSFPVLASIPGEGYPYYMHAAPGELVD